MSSFPRQIGLFGLMGAALVACACEQSTTTSDGRPMPPEPRAARTTPEVAPVNAIAIVMSPKPLDTNGNLKPDAIQMQLYLFARPYPAPTRRDGSIEFAIYPTGMAGSPDRPGPNPIRTWVISNDRLQTVRTRSLVGEGYALTLSLLENGGTDVIGAQDVDLVARFVPNDGGEAVPAMDVRTLSMTGPNVQPGR